MRLVILGAGGFAKEVLSWCLQATTFRQVTFFDERAQSGQKIFDFPVVSSLDNAWAKKLHFIPGVGDPVLRKRLYEMAVEKGLQPLGPVVHPKATVGVKVNVGHGTIICPGAVLTTNIVAARGLIVNLNATIGHDCRLGEFVTVSPGANISGGCTIGDMAYIGTNCSVREKVSIHQTSTVGMGSALVRSTSEPGVFVGIPAKAMKQSAPETPN